MKAKNSKANKPNKNATTFEIFIEKKVHVLKKL